MNSRPEDSIETLEAQALAQLSELSVLKKSGANRGAGYTQAETHRQNFRALVKEIVTREHPGAGAVEVRRLTHQKEAELTDKFNEGRSGSTGVSR